MTTFQNAGVSYRNARHAINAGNASAPRVVAFDKILSAWVLYHPEFPLPDVEPDVLCVKEGRLPVPLSDAGRAIVADIVMLGAEART